MPPYYREDPAVQALLDAGARELQRVEDALSNIRERFFPHNADDTLNMLSIWEATLGLPVRPAGVSVLERQTAVLSAVRKRRSGSGADWMSNISAALGDVIWTHRENYPGGYQLTIEIPYDPASYTAGQVLRLINQITPAHIQIVSGFSEGFLVGISQVGVEPV